MIPPDAVELVDHLWPSVPVYSRIYMLGLVPYPRVAATYDGHIWRQEHDLGPQTYMSAAAWDERCTKKAAYADVRYLSALWADIDPTPDETEVDALAVLTRLHSKGLRPSVVDSGRGCQVWQALDEPVAVEDPREVKRGLQRFARAVAEALGHPVDMACAEPSRILRCPGTVNAKTGREAQLVCLGERWSHRDMGAWVDQWAPRDPAPWVPPAVPRVTSDKRHRRALDLLAAHPVGCRGYNDLCYLTGVRLRDAGHEEWAEAEATIARLSAQGCGAHNIESFQRGVKPK